MTYWQRMSSGFLRGAGISVSFRISGTVIKRLIVYTAGGHMFLSRESADEELLKRQAELEEYITRLGELDMNFGGTAPQDEWVRQDDFHGLAVWVCVHGPLRGTVSEQEDPDVPEMAWQLRTEQFHDFRGVDYFATEEEAKEAFRLYVLEEELARC